MSIFRLAKRGLPKTPSVKKQTHLRKHWKKYAHIGLHGGGGVIAYGVGISHGASLKSVNPYQRKTNRDMQRVQKKLNKGINKLLKDKGY